MRWPFGDRQSESVDPQAAYALWAKHYPPRPHNALMEAEQQAVLAMLPDLRGRAALDAGCGTGRYLQELEARGAFAIGVDLSAAMIERARTVSTRVLRADLRALPLDAGSIDVVVCGLALGDVSELEVAVAEIARVLRAGGCAIYSVVHPDGGALGWSRTFESDGRRLAVNGFWHSLDRHRQACSAAGLSIDEWREPRLPDRPGQSAALIVRAHKS